MKANCLSLVTIALLCIVSAAYGAVTKDRILLGLSSNHTRVFSKDDLFSEPLQPQEWYRFLSEVKLFVADNGKGDKKLVNALDTILASNDTMINSIKVSYNALFASGGSYQAHVAQSGIQKLQQVVTDMQEVQKKIVKEYYIYKSKRAVREVLDRLALAVESTAQKAINDLRKKMPKESKQTS